MGIDSPLGLYPEKAVILDPIHNAIPVNAAEFAIIQTRYLRRLHNIRQLGLVHLIYPQATHTRFAHSLGVMHLAGSMAYKIAQATPSKHLYDYLLADDRGGKGLETLVTLARLAGLLHDVGHMPFSHALEGAVKRLTEWADASSSRPHEDSLIAKVSDIVIEKASEWRIMTVKPHERLTYMLIQKLAEAINAARRGSNTDIHLGELYDGAISDVDKLPLLVETVAETLHGSQDCRAIARGLEGRLAELGLRPEAACLIKGIIANDIVDADRLDYLVRDSLNTGVIFGRIDYERLLSNMSFAVRDGNPCIVLGDKALPTLEDIFDARFKMYRSVYFHHKSVALSIALTRSLAEIIDHWDMVSPQEYRRCGDVPVILNPVKVAECIDEGKISFDDNEFEVMLRRAAQLGGRWARSIVKDRPLLPVSLIKRPEALIHKALSRIMLSKREGSANEPRERVRQMSLLAEFSSKLKATLTYEMAEIEEELRKAIASHVRSRKEDIRIVIEAQTVVDTQILSSKGIVCPERGDSLLSSLYLRLVVEAALTPLVYAYVFSDDVRIHLTLYKHREALRRTAEDILIRFMVRMINGAES